MKSGLLVSSGHNLAASTLLAGLAAEGAAPAVVYCVRVPGWRLLVRVLGRNGVRGAWSRVVARATGGRRGSDLAVAELGGLAAQRRWRGWNETVPRLCGRLNIPCVFTSSMNAPAIAADVRARRLDLLLNMSGEILRLPLIGAPSVGILNGHTGPLPEVRGFNAVEWSLLLGIAPTLSVHFIDAGVDTGAVVTRAGIPWQRGETIAQLRARASAVQVATLVDVVREQRWRARPAVAPAPGPQFYAMHPRLRVLVERHRLGIG